MLNSLAVGSSGQIFNELCRYKEKGNAMPMKVMETVPVQDRLPGLVQTYGLEKITAVLAKTITKALSNFNLRVGMNSDQVYELALQVIDAANEDQLAIEDIMLFLDGMSKAKYGKVYDRMDMPTFFEMLEVYREQRHQEYMRFKEEQDAQFKSYGDTARLSTEVDKDQMREAMKSYMQNSVEKK